MLLRACYTWPTADFWHIYLLYTMIIYICKNIFCQYENSPKSFFTIRGHPKKIVVAQYAYISLKEILDKIFHALRVC